MCTRHTRAHIVIWFRPWTFYISTNQFSCVCTCAYVFPCHECGPHTRIYTHIQLHISLKCPFVWMDGFVCSMQQPTILLPSFSNSFYAAIKSIKRKDYCVLFFQLPNMNLLHACMYVCTLYISIWIMYTCCCAVCASIIITKQIWLLACACHSSMMYCTVRDYTS